MNENDVPSAKKIIKRVIILLAIIILLVLSVICAKYYKSRVKWKTLFDLSYSGSSDRGYEYELENKTNNSYSLTTVYIKISDAHRDYIIELNIVRFGNSHSVDKYGVVPDLQSFTWKSYGSFHIVFTTVDRSPHHFPKNLRISLNIISSSAGRFIL